MKTRLFALLLTTLGIHGQDQPAPAGLPFLQGKIEVELDGKKETLDLADPATAQRLKGKVIITTEINGQRETRVVNADEVDHLPAPFLWNEKPPVRTGPVTFLGVGAVEVPAEVAAQLTLPQDTGLQIAIVLPDSPAAAAGLQESDIIQKFEDQILITPRQFAVLIANRKEGDTIKLSILRKGQPMEIAATLGKREAPHAAESPDKVAQVKRDMVQLEGDAVKAGAQFDKMRADFERLRSGDGPGHVKMRVKVNSGGAETKEEIAESLVHEGWQTFRESGHAVPRSAPATEDTGKALRRALDKMPPEPRAELEQILREYDVLPEGALQPAK